MNAIAGWIAENATRHFLFRERFSPMRMIEEEVSLNEKASLCVTRDVSRILVQESSKVRPSDLTNYKTFGIYLPE